MRPPFPGMDPWLEHPSMWPEVHNRLIAAIADDLSPRVFPKYYVGVEQRTVLFEPDQPERLAVADVAVLLGEPGAVVPERAGQGGPGAVVEVEVPLAVEIQEWFLEIRTVEGGRLVTILEVLSPSNKNPGRDRRKYERKRRRIFESRTSLVEIDLLRGGVRLPIRGDVPRSDYRILISRSRQRPRAQLLPFSLRDPIPPFDVPLQPGDDEPVLDVAAVLHALCDRAHFDARIRYDEPPVPPLREEDAAWAREIVARR